MTSKYILLTALIILSSAALLSYTWGKKQASNSLKYQQENHALTTQLSELDTLKSELQTEIDSLIIAYDLVTAQKAQLQRKLSNTNAQLVERDATIANLQESFDLERMSLTERIKALIELKSNLQTTIHTINRQNDSMVVEIKIIEKDRMEARRAAKIARTQNLKRKKENEGLLLPDFLAAGFRVELEGKNGKIVSKGKRVKRVKISFDLNEIPEKYQGKRPLYLVIKNSDNQTIARNTLFPVHVERGEIHRKMNAIMRKEQDIESEQRLLFNYELEDKLSSGNYWVEIYTDICLLGTTSFRVG